MLTKIKIFMKLKFEISKSLKAICQVVRAVTGNSKRLVEKES